MTRIVEDPIPVGPFLDWCNRRRGQIARELDHWPMIGGASNRSTVQTAAPASRLVTDLGWDNPVDTGVRRLHRLQHDNPRAIVSRALAEDALWRAGVHIYDVYPDLAIVDEHGSRCFEEMTRDEKTQVAWWLYEMGMSFHAVGVALGYGEGGHHAARRLLTPEVQRERDRQRNVRRAAKKQEWARQRRESMQYWTREMVLTAMHDWTAEYEIPPAALDWSPAMADRRDPDRADRFRAGGNRWPTTRTVTRLFGSWNAAMMEAGFEPRPSGRPETREVVAA